MGEQAQILVVDDDVRLAASLRRALIYEGYAVEVTGDGPAALACARARPPDLVVLDLMLPGLDGVQVATRLRAAGDVPILMLTARDATADRVQGLDAGADDYLVKPFDYDEFLARVRALLRRRAPRPSQILRYADLSMDVAAHEVRRGDRSVQFTAHEFALLRHLLRHPRQVFGRDQLLDSVWGYESGAASNVVDVYIGYLRQKLEEQGDSRLIQTVRGVGYVLREA